MRHAVILIIVLSLYWLALSGHYVPFILTLGACSILFVIGLCHRMGILDAETAPYLYVPKTLKYYVWLFKEIAKANMTVVKAVLANDLEVSPSLVVVKAPQKTELGRAMFANSITLTPGTVSVEVMQDEILVHALLSDMAVAEDFTDMARRSGQSVGEA